jgi:protein-disulfide isomerase
MNRPMGPDMNKVYSFNATGGPAAGPEGAPVTVVVFADILSPQAQMMLDTVNDLKTKFPDQARVVFKNLPDPRRPQAALAHQAAMEAFAQGKFWEMLALIVKNRDAITPEALRKLAGDAGLNLTQFDAAMKDNRHGQELANNAAEAAGASAMPPLSYFVNGRFSPDARPPALEAIVRKNLEGAPK